MKYRIKPRQLHINPEKAKIIERKKKDQRFLKMSIISVIAFIGLANLWNDPSSFRMYIDNINWVIKPYTTIKFEKVSNSRPNQHIVLPGGFIELERNFNTYITYDDKFIYFYESLALQTPLNKIEINGKIKSVSSFYFSPSLSSAMNFIKKIDQTNIENINDLSGFFIHCEYVGATGEKLVVYHIDNESYEYYARSLLQSPEQKNEMIKEIANFRQEAKKYPFIKMPGNVSDDNRIVHPALGVKKMLEIPFDELEFCCFAGQARFISKNINKHYINLHGWDGKILSSYKIGKPFIYTMNNNCDRVSFYTFDGVTLRVHNVENDVKPTSEIAIKNGGELKDARFIPGNDTKTSLYYNPVLVNAGRIYSVDNERDNPRSVEIETKPDTKMTFYNMMTEAGKYYQCDINRLDRNEIPYKPLGLFLFDWRSKELDKYNFSVAILSGLNINLCVDKENKPVVFFDICDKLRALETSGINEPVDEAFLTFYQDTCSIYFMNRKSIYKAMFDEDEFYYFKYRKQSYKSEPIKTTQK